MTQSIFNRPQTNFELMDIAKKLNLTLKGVFMKDELKGKIPDGNYILNLESSNENGSHWTALYKTKNKYYYADSFGVAIPETLIKNLNINENNLFFNEIQIQDLYSTRCGFFALYFLYCMNQKQPIQTRINNFLKPFDFEQKKENDDIIKSFFQRI